MSHQHELKTDRMLLVSFWVGLRLEPSYEDCLGLTTAGTKLAGHSTGRGPMVCQSEATCAHDSISRAAHP